jgi:aminomuconate-semialdehyde/2-hydroxymuconate-6-semialdehyde dehydrogenase
MKNDFFFLSNCCYDPFITKWSKTPVAARAKILLKIAETIEANLDWLTEAESEDQGKPVAFTKRMDIPRAALNFTAFAEAVTSFEHVLSLFT